MSHHHQIGRMSSPKKTDESVICLEAATQLISGCVKKRWLALTDLNRVMIFENKTCEETETVVDIPKSPTPRRNALKHEAAVVESYQERRQSVDWNPYLNVPSTHRSYSAEHPTRPRGNSITHEANLTLEVPQFSRSRRTSFDHSRRSTCDSNTVEIADVGDCVDEPRKQSQLTDTNVFFSHIARRIFRFLP